MALLTALFARVNAKVRLVCEYKQLVGDVYEAEKTVETLRKAKEDCKYNSDLYEAELYLSKKTGVEKVTEAFLKAIVETDDVVKAYRNTFTDAEHKYKLGIVELTNLYNKLQAIKLELTA